MATLKQKRVARKIPKIIESNQDITGGELVSSVGYSDEMAKKPGTILNSPGVQSELTKLGFTEEKAKEVVSQILSDESIKPEPRLKAAEMVFKVHGTFAPEKHLSLTVTAVASDKIKDLAQALLQKQKER